MYSNNGRIVDADDEYLSTSEWRFTNRLFRIEQIQQSIFPSNPKLQFERIGFCEYPNNPNNLITGYTPYNWARQVAVGRLISFCKASNCTTFNMAYVVHSWLARGETRISCGNITTTKILAAMVRLFMIIFWRGGLIAYI